MANKKRLYFMKGIFFIILIISLAGGAFAFSFNWKAIKPCNNITAVYNYGRSTGRDSFNSAPFITSYDGTSTGPFVLEGEYNPVSLDFKSDITCSEGTDNRSFSYAGGNIGNYGDDPGGQDSTWWVYSFIFVEEAEVTFTAQIDYDDGGFMHFLWYDERPESKNFYLRAGQDNDAGIGGTGTLGRKTITLSEPGWYMIFHGMLENRGATSTNYKVYDTKDSEGNEVTLEELLEIFLLP